MVFYSENLIGEKQQDNRGRGELCSPVKTPFLLKQGGRTQFAPTICTRQNMEVKYRQKNLRQIPPLDAHDKIWKPKNKRRKQNINKDPGWNTTGVQK